ncbi:MAG: polyketide cyclase [Chloroflexi bacterium]|uniref:Polyketide cyclase n=1 Tax=Candidatus Chlorohelix allophototropha TaxID=3003348 RepID=A0A8T7M8J8_9CHLR|nr:polyketide cyclase [Chloroflexota bacterium]WJW68420.1 SRPBCC family protein [Chloroflexota bacterium L227-S17]
MSSNEYHFISHWRVESTLEEVSAVIGNGLDLVRWWPAVYLEVKELEKGDEKGIGKVIDLYTKGWLPYTLRWRFKVTESHAPHGFSIEAKGDFVGRGIWTFAQDGKYVNIIYDWKIQAEKPLLKYFSFVMKPIFAANHRWAMQKGEESLKLELQRRHAKSREELARIPAPPKPTTTSTIPITLGMLGASGAIVALIVLISKTLKHK